VVKIFSPQLARKGNIIEVKNEEDLEYAGSAFLKFLKDRDLFELIPKSNGGG
jgi:hypothetical protein